MKTTFLTLFIVVIISFIGGVFASKSKLVNYIYVPAPSGPPDACTMILFGYTCTNNGHPPILKTASSALVTTGCRVISIYPEQAGTIGLK